MPAAPSNLAATAVSASHINLSWNDNANNETGFKIERWTGSARAQIAQTGANTTSYANTGLAASTTYYYRVYAFNDAGSSAVPNWVSATTPAGSTPTLPAAPSNLAATAVSASQINLSWNDNANNETGFKIERSSGTGWTQIAQTGANVTSYANTGLAAGTTYSYRVSAYNSAGSSASSNSASATTQNESQTADSVHVASLVGTASIKNKKFWDASATITIVDQDSAPVAGVTVEASWDSGGTVGVTDSSGQVTFSNERLTSNSITFRVQNITISGYVYDADSNAATTLVLNMP